MPSYLFITYRPEYKDVIQEKSLKFAKNLQILGFEHLKTTKLDFTRHLHRHNLQNLHPQGQLLVRSLAPASQVFCLYAYLLP